MKIYIYYVKEYMTEEKLNEYLKRYPFLKKYISLKKENIGVELIKVFWGKYVVLKWTDFEYGKSEGKKVFKSKNEALTYLWDLFGGESKLRELIKLHE
jgi:hypothetical protein